MRMWWLAPGVAALGLAWLCACGEAPTKGDGDGGGGGGDTDTLGPKPPATGAFETGRYRNMLKEWRPTLTDAEVQAKLDTFWTSLFGTDAQGSYTADGNRRVYFPGSPNADGPTAYIMDIGNNDIRSEGMSYGMMIAVQMNRKAEFDALWNWAKSNMYYASGPRQGYFRWTCQPTGCLATDPGPAPDGEEYMAMALFFAAHRWHHGAGIYDYETQANAILDAMLHKEDMNNGRLNGITNMFDATAKEVVFVPYGSSAQITDPSYHLPAFYELWGRWARGWNGRQASDRQFWLDAAAASRRFFMQAAHPATGLTPERAYFDGSAMVDATRGDFRYDAMRTAVNWAVDYAWFAADPNEKTLSDRIQAFFESQGMSRYVAEYTLSGTPLTTARSTGQMACNAATALAATRSRAWLFVETLWGMEPPTGQWRYYDGLLTFMALLHLSGNFRIY